MTQPAFQSALEHGLEHDALLAAALDRRSLDRLFSATYEELRRLASSVRRADANATLSTTTLVNEAWLKMALSPAAAPASRLHFKRIAARAMRQVLIQSARRRRAVKRGSGAVAVTLEEGDAGTADDAALLALDAALEELAAAHPRQAAIVESRFFGGFDVAEIAELLGVSEATVQRDWRAARAWLARELHHAK